MTEVCTVNYIDHVGVAVKDIEASLAFFKKVFDVPDAKIELLEDQGVRATLIEVGQTRLELLEPTGPGSGVGRFIERRGEGLHHLAFNVTDISGKLQTLKTLGVDLIDRLLFGRIDIRFRPPAHLGDLGLRLVFDLGGELGRIGPSLIDDLAHFVVRGF